MLKIAISVITGTLYIKYDIFAATEMKHTNYLQNRITIIITKTDLNRLIKLFILKITSMSYCLPKNIEIKDKNIVIIKITFQVKY